MVTLQVSFTFCESSNKFAMEIGNTQATLHKKVIMESEAHEQMRCRARLQKNAIKLQK